MENIDRPARQPFPWHRGPLLALDTETTGPDPDTDHIVTATCAWIAPGPPVAVDVDTWLINPGVPIPADAAAVHGITTEHAQVHGRPPAEALTEIAAVLARAIAQGVPLVAYNAAFDITVLDREFTRHGIDLDLTAALVVDPRVLDKEVDRWRNGRRTLTAVCQHYRVRLDAAHDATADALAAARVAWRIAETHPRMQMPLPDLHAAQAAWRAEQAEDLERHFTDIGKPRPVAREWPLLPWATALVCA